MGSALHQLCPRYSGTLTSTAPMAMRLWETLTFYFIMKLLSSNNGTLIGTPEFNTTENTVKLIWI